MNTPIKITMDELYESCLYSMIAHTVANLRYPLLSYEQSWDGMSYSYIMDSARGTVTFDFTRRLIVGAAREEKSFRKLNYPGFSALSLFEEASEECQKLAEEEALQYLLDTFDETTIPCATTALWNDGERLFVYGTYEDFVENGGEFLRTICVPISELREYWQEQCDFTKKEAALVEKIYEMKHTGQLKLPRQQLWLMNKKNDGYREFVTSLSEIGISV